MKDEVVVVIGGTKGIGAAVTRLIAGEGGKVVFCGRSEAPGLALQEEIRAVGGDATFVACDIQYGDQIKAVIDKAAEIYGRLTVLVNNAAATDAMRGLGDTTEISEEVWTEYLRLGLTNAVFLPVKYAVPHMKAAGHGSIVNIGSATAIRGTNGPAPYTAAKGAEASLTRHWALCYAEHNIRCNTLLPGFVATSTATMETLMADPVVFAVYRDAHLLGIGEPNDVAYAILWLASRESKWITGLNIPIEGGATSYIPSAKGLRDPAIKARRMALLREEEMPNAAEAPSPETSSA